MKRNQAEEKKSDRHVHLQELLRKWAGRADQGRQLAEEEQVHPVALRVGLEEPEDRLAEQEIAEAFCEMHHIPTRTEMDEVQRSVTELKREVRGLRRTQDRPAEAAPAKKAARKRAKKRR